MSVLHAWRQVEERAGKLASQEALAAEADQQLHGAAEAAGSAAKQAEGLQAAVADLSSQVWLHLHMNVSQAVIDISIPCTVCCSVEGVQMQRSKLEATRLAVQQRTAQEEADATARRQKRNRAQEKKLGEEQCAAE